MKKIITVFFATSICVTTFAQNEEGFVLVKAEPPIEVHERWVDFPGKHPVVSSRELKSEFIVNTTAKKVIAFIKDETQVKSWRSHISKYKIYLKPDSTEWEEYACHDVPWPLSDQDSFMEYKLSETVPGREYLVVFRSRVDPKVAPLNKDANRIELVGSWKMEQTSEGVTKVTYRIQSAPATHLPRMVVDPFVRGNLLSSMKSMTEILEKKK